MSETDAPHSPPAWQPELPKLGGVIGEAPEDFEVEEVPLYAASGAGSHWYLWVEKRGLNTREVVRLFAEAGGVDEGEIGTAGLKDKNAVTRQWVSVPESAKAPETWQLPDGVRILEVTRHTNKLRTGHLLGNRFQLRLLGCDPDWQGRWGALSAALGSHGYFNYFGPQRFGINGQNLGRALFWLKKGAKGRGFQPRLYASVLQSEAFNRYLSARREVGFEQALLGEVVRLANTGKHFRVADVEAERERWETKDILPTGPMAGPKMVAADAAAGELEQQAITALRLDSPPRAFVKLAPGTRRDLLVFPENVSLELDGDALRLSFGLPSGCYATELVSALTGAMARPSPHRDAV
ncbi:MAG: tRNA pseudouridine(13) synthase TruD [Polyangiaceae bacterium]|nr:tRNA pseudouridine(13) synthase TruD [Myxococcales bacterium]MCB9587446.1 tRNA pseudouridine(13) synthase TruD [Polyangiaceae bacterium]MCB9605757.1 tRNA pseudouridine(13) synthase TruD [Polyangiaceae bacterium]